MLASACHAPTLPAPRAPPLSPDAGCTPPQPPPLQDHRTRYWVAPAEGCQARRMVLGITVARVSSRGGGRGAGEGETLGVQSRRASHPPQGPSLVIQGPLRVRRWARAFRGVQPLMSPLGPRFCLWGNTDPFRVPLGPLALRAGAGPPGLQGPCEPHTNGHTRAAPPAQRPSPRGAAAADSTAGGGGGAVFLFM